MHLNPVAKNKSLASAKAKASEMRRAAQILLERAAELDALAEKNGTASSRNGMRLDSAVPARRCNGRDLAQSDTRKYAGPLSNSGRRRRAKQRLYR